MAQAILGETKLRLQFEVGLDENGKPVFKTKTFSNINKEATADQLDQVAKAIAILSKDVLSGVERADSSDILA